MDSVVSNDTSEGVSTLQLGTGDGDETENGAGCLNGLCNNNDWAARSYSSWKPSYNRRGGLGSGRIVITVKAALVSDNIMIMI